MTTAIAGDIAVPGAAEALGGLIASLADNKGLLGRRYGEWAVSAPTLESGVAAAAMAQDELGHARSTYPLLKQLGLPEAAEHAHVDPARCLPMLEAELPDWESFIAVNLVIDGALSAFVEASVDSAFEPLAQRARKILQEESSHAVHASAWTRRLTSGDGEHAARFAQRLETAWEQAARWYGPADEPGFRTIVEARLVALGPDALRGRLRAHVRAAYAAEGASPALALSEPTSFDGWSPELRR